MHANGYALAFPVEETFSQVSSNWSLPNTQQLQPAASEEEQRQL